jgi:hypothetical protein
MRMVAWIKARDVDTRGRLPLEVVPLSSYVNKYEQKPGIVVGLCRV